MKLSVPIASTLVSAVLVSAARQDDSSTASSQRLLQEEADDSSKIVKKGKKGKKDVKECSLGLDLDGGKSAPSKGTKGSGADTVTVRTCKKNWERRDMPSKVMYYVFNTFQCICILGHHLQQFPS
jgi:hypothetical protein